MKRSESQELARVIYRFLHEYAPAHLTRSEHTLKSYEDSLRVYIGYLEDECGVKILDFGARHFERERIENFLAWLERERSCSPSTCNNRLAGIRAFLKYAGSVHPDWIYLYQQSMEIPVRKARKMKVHGISKKSFKIFLSCVDTSRPSGRRDIAYLILAYCSAARIDELLSLKIKQLQLDAARPCLHILGKGNKQRTIYLPGQCVKVLKKYLKEFHGDHPNEESLLFYSKIQGKNGKLTQQAINKRLRLLAKEAHEKDPDIPLNFSSHQIRHSRASHWLEEGMNLLQISFLLGHESLETTKIYLDVTREQEIQALEKLDSGTIPKRSRKKRTI